MSDSNQPNEAARYTVWQLMLYFLRLGALGFGGPVALVGYMHRDLVEERKWITDADYKEGLALAQIAPGPLAAQLAIYLGFVHHRILGATVAAFAFVLPSFLMVVGLGMAYVSYGGLPWMQAVFYGVSAAVLGIMAVGAHKLSTRSIGKDKLLWAIFAVLAIVTIVTQSEIAWLFIASGILVWVIRCKPKFGNVSWAAASACRSRLDPPDWPLLRQGGDVRLRLRPCHRPLSLWRRRH